MAAESLKRSVAPAIRPARPDEASTLTDLALRSKAVWGYDAAFIARCRSILTVTPAKLKAWPFFVAELDGRIVGFYGLEPEEAGAVGLDFFFVAPDAIGHGIGRALWQHAVGTARAGKHPALVVVSDPHAESFYRRMGAVPAGSRPSDLAPGRHLPVLRFALC